MTERYRVYIGEASTADVTSLAAEYFQGATISPAIGLWEGEVERSVIVEVIGGNPVRVRLFAEDARERFNQTAVLVTEETITSYLVEREVTADATA